MTAPAHDAHTGGRPAPELAAAMAETRKIRREAAAIADRWDAEAATAEEARKTSGDGTYRMMLDLRALLLRGPCQGSPGPRRDPPGRGRRERRNHVSIYQLQEPCWELTDPADDERTPHFTSEQDAREALKELRDAPREPYQADPKASIRLLEHRCWVVQCDGEDGYILDEEDEGYIFHHESIADALDSVAAYEWRRIGDSVFCPADAPEGSDPPPPTAAEQEQAGQLRLPGVPA